ncbi:ribonuclease III [Porphyromonas macacae]|uniref:Ribonuclease 3 n=1 Tax=Porphyromonas macacae TaxID=28115 RepID=A0A0A2E018_9PORP|nr:ribonuclease III [Porphyromonas macacae]KGN72263.1 ribonuclease III [Porphyromonas macacae]KGN98539.1 ribonuclease III [Porphyromonas macacae]
MFIDPTKIRRLLGRKTDEPLFYLTQVLGFKPRNLKYYNIAFRHVSCSLTDDKGVKINNERMEFLGDSVLSAVVSYYLYSRYPSWDEGRMSQRRSALVKRAVNNAISRELCLDRFMIIKPEALSTSNDVYGNTLEALIGAIFLDRGYHYAERFIINRILPVYKELEKELTDETSNYKSILLEWVQKHHYTIEFRMVQEPKRNGAEFVCVVFVNEERLGMGRGLNKKEAHQQAAHDALENLSKTDPEFKQKPVEEVG